MYSQDLSNYKTRLNIYRTGSTFLYSQDLSNYKKHASSLYPSQHFLYFQDLSDYTNHNLVLLDMYYIQKDILDTIVAEVVQGDWGNGEERKERLEAAGYDYDPVQQRVNELLG